MPHASVPIKSVLIHGGSRRLISGAAFVTIQAKGGSAADFVPNWIDSMTVLHKTVAPIALAAAIASLFAPIASAQQTVYAYGAQGGYGAQPYAASGVVEQAPAWQAQGAAAACGGCQGVRVIYVQPQTAAQVQYASTGVYGQGDVVLVAPCQTCGPPAPQEVRFTADSGGGVGGEPGGYYGGGGRGETGLSGYGNISGWVGSHSATSASVNVNVNNNVSASAQAWANASARSSSHSGGHGGGHGCGCVKPPPPPCGGCTHH